MSEEKQRIANEVFPQSGIPYSRLKKEFLQATYDVEIKEPLHWIIRKTIDDIPIVLDVKIPLTYPFVAPEVIVLSPKPFIHNTKHFWGPVKGLDSLFSFVLETLRTYRSPDVVPAPPEIQDVIDLVKRTEKPVHLVLGSHPGEHPVGRTIYSDPHIFLLDESAGSGDFSRFFKIDFTDLQQLKWLCSQLPGAFDTIILDTSTMKFFTPHPDKPHDQLKFLESLGCLFTLLSDTGVFFMAEPGSAYGGVVPIKQVLNQSGKIVWVRDESIRPGQIMKEMVESVGFQVEKKSTEELTHPLVQRVHKDRTDGMGSRYFLVATKPKKGGRRKSTRRKLKRRKHTKRR
jgi:hypothetical protein